MDKQTTRWTLIHCPRQTEPFPLYPRIQRERKKKKQTVHTGSYFDSGGEQFNDGRRQRGRWGAEEAGSVVAHGDRRSAFRWMGPGS